MKKVILITGVAGMIGSNLLKTVINKKNIIIGIDNFTLGKKKNIKTFLKNKNFHFFNKNLDREIRSEKINKLLKKNRLTEVWLLAANSDIKKGTLNSDVDLKNTFLTTYFSLHLVKKFLNKSTKIIFSSTAAIYGNTNNKVIEENTPTKPISNYGAMKLASEAYISAFCENFNVRAIIYRFPNVTGPNLTHGLLYDMKKKFLLKNNFVNVLGNGLQQKPYSYVSEIVKCMKFFKNKKFNKKVIYLNIGTNDKGIKVKNIVDLIKRKFKSKKRVIYQKSKIGWVGDVPMYRYSTRKINKLGYKFKFTSKDVILKTVKNL